MNEIVGYALGYRMYQMLRNLYEGFGQFIQCFESAFFCLLILLEIHHEELFMAVSSFGTHTINF
ncbi:MAG: hypothetical protein QM539_04210 [Alphaproteobacteria bacterium]|nr:hypothetical protein [Alphaproteobacteria bacterium]